MKVYLDCIIILTKKKKYKKSKTSFLKFLNKKFLPILANLLWCNEASKIIWNYCLIDNFLPSAFQKIEEEDKSEENRVVKKDVSN